MQSILVATFYQFVPLADRVEWQRSLQQVCQEQGIKGTILLALEGINATIAGTPSAIAAVLAVLRQDPRFANLTVKESWHETPPFERLKVRLKQEIVTLGQPDVNPCDRVGTYVRPQDWNMLLADPEVLVIDTRNDYEVSIGTFQGAQNPQTRSFREFPTYVQTHLDPQHHRKVALFCTGGIRCEKATSYLLQQGFEEVYHLEGGILKYLETVPAAESLWQGECFVFDERVAVQHGLEVGTHDLCRSCGHPISAADKASPQYEAGITCPHCYHQLTPEKRARQEARRQQTQQQSA